MCFTDYLFNLTEVVQCNGIFSEVVLLSCGVSQGSIVGPFLFLIQFNVTYNVLLYSETKTYTDNTVIYCTK